jgi:hypothetical protein
MDLFELGGFSEDVKAVSLKSLDFRYEFAISVNGPILGAILSVELVYFDAKERVIVVELSNPGIAHWGYVLELISRDKSIARSGILKVPAFEFSGCLASVNPDRLRVDVIDCDSNSVIGSILIEVG